MNDLYDPSKNDSNYDWAIVYSKTNLKSSKPIESSNDDFNNNENAFVGQRLITCGFGSIDNYRNKSKELLCTSLRVVPNVECGETYVNKGLICSINKDDSNVCGGDIGKVTI